MNREIKFRAWDSVHNRMIYSDKHLGYMPFDDNCFCNYDFNISKKGVYCFAYDDYNDEITNETNLPIMMWTGLNDKNGVEVYEGDIVKAKFYGKEVVGEIGFNSGCFLLWNSCVSDNQLFIFTDIEVIGNVWDKNDC